jgi:hypothetical protein
MVLSLESNGVSYEGAKYLADVLLDNQVSLVLYKLSFHQLIILDFNNPESRLEWYR